MLRKLARWHLTGSCMMHRLGSLPMGQLWDCERSQLSISNSSQGLTGRQDALHRRRVLLMRACTKT